MPLFYEFYLFHHITKPSAKIATLQLSAYKGVGATRILDDGPEVNNNSQTSTTTEPVLFYGVGNTNQINTGTTTSSSENYTAPRINAGESVESPDF